MVDTRTFRGEHPEFCPDSLPVPGLDPQMEGSASQVRDWEDACERVMEVMAWEDAPVARKLMQTHGAEAFGYYLSFRRDPAIWGMYLSGSALVGLAKEVHRVLNLGYSEMSESVPEEAQRKLAFGMAFDVGVNHLSFHAAVDAFTATKELEEEKPLYGPYMQGSYSESLANPDGDLGYNLEEALANVTALRSFLNPNAAVELGSSINDSLDEDGQYRWNAYLMSGNLTTELAYIMRAYPPGYRNFTDFLRRRGEVGPYAHMAIQYDLDTTAFNDALRRLASIILGEEVEDAEKDLVKPVSFSTYLVEGSHDRGRDSDSPHHPPSDGTDD